jgi:hypothetical protein
MAALGGRPSGEESPGSTETRCRLTAGGGDPRESATENRPPGWFASQARVKRWGKSPPRERQRKRHGKPHREQDQIGAARRATGTRCFRAAARVGRARRSATGVPEEWPSIAFRGVDRTRLTGRLTRSFHRPRLASQAAWDASDIDSIRDFCRRPGIPPHPLCGTVWDGGTAICAVLPNRAQAWPYILRWKLKSAQ